MSADIRGIRQQKIAEWCEAAFGSEQSRSVEHRGLRQFEESAEAAQAAGCDPAKLHALIDYVYSRPPGDLRQEIGGVAVCILALCAAAGIDADEAETAEIERVLSKPLEHFRARNQAKVDLGFEAGRKEGTRAG